MNKYLSIFFLLFVSCSLFDSDESAEIIELDRTWEVVQFIDSDGDKVNIEDDEILTLRFSDETSLGGEADCNQYGGDYIARENGRINITNLISTEMACIQPSYGDEFVTALSNTSKFFREEGRLILYFGDDGKLIFFERLE